MTNANTNKFDRDKYAKTYYKDYYQKNREKINEIRRKRITLDRIETNYGVKLTDELYAIYDENREIYNKVFRQLKQNKENMVSYTNINPLLVEHFNNHLTF